LRFSRALASQAAVAKMPIATVKQLCIPSAIVGAPTPEIKHDD
jgi:hypothetical protein